MKISLIALILGFVAGLNWINLITLLREDYKSVGGAITFVKFTLFLALIIGVFLGYLIWG